MVIFFQTEKTPEGRDLKGRTFMKDYSIDIALGKENLR